MAKKVQLQTNGKEWQMVDGEQVLVDVEKQDIDPITSSSCVQIEGFRTLEEAVSDNKMLSQDLTYTNVMDKVGGDYHQNVLDGQYSKAILYGNTQVNLCEEDTSNVLQIPTTFTSFNNGELQIDNKENEVVAPLIKGVTMVNLAQTNSASLASSESVTIENVKGNTLYTLSFKFTTKNTNSGITIESYNGDTYLENIMKTELGDVAKFTFTTHTNATIVKVVNNPAYGGQTIQLDDIMLIEGDQTALDIPFFKGMKSVELVRPLTNLFANDIGITSEKTTFTNTDGNVVVTSSSSSSWCHINIVLNKKLKSNTKYLVMWDNLTATQTSTSNTETLISVYGTGNVRLGYINNNLLCPTKRSIIFDTANHDISQIKIRIHATLSNTETGTTTVTGLRVFEYDDYSRSVDLQSIGYFSGTKNVAVEPIKTCGKNLYPYGDVNFTSAGSNWYDAKGNINMYGDIASKSKSRFLLKKGTYTLSIGSTQNIEQYGLVDDKETTYGNTFTLSQDTYMTLRFKRIQAETLTTATNIQIERGTTATDYVAHDSRYYEPNGQNAIVLRSLPGGICDTFNLQTGEYTRRIGEIIIDGSEDWKLSTRFSSTYNSYYFVLNETFRKDIKYANDKYQLLDGEDLGKNIGLHMGNDYNNIAPFISSDKMTLSEFKEYLQQNPVTVQYELATPVTTIIPRTIKRNNNGTVSTVDFQTYTNKESLVLPKNPSYLTINSMTSIKPVVEPITYIDFKTRLKANTDYSIIMDKNSTDKTINLGGTSKTYTGKMLVRTPSINLEQNLRISGSGSIQNIMVIEGDVLNKELPYFNGMCNVKMPIVRNCGKNFITGKVIEKVPDVVVFEICRLKPNQQYIISSNYNFAQGRVSLVGKNNEFIIQDWAENKKIFKAPSDVYNYNQIRFWKAGLVYDEVTMYFQLEELESGTQPTSYEPYRGNDICIVEDNVALRSLPNGVKDELNLLTGEYIQRIGEVVLDGSEDENWKLNNTENTSTKRFIIDILTGSNITNDWNGANKYVCDKIHKYLWSDTVEFGITVIDNSVFLYNNNIDYSIGALKTWLSQNPITVQYELAEPIISYPRIVSNTQEREVGVKLPNGVCDTYNPSTGITVKRVGKAILDGSEDWHEPFAVPTSGAVNMYNIWTEQPLNNAKPAPTNERIPGVCDSLKFKNSALDLTNEEFYFISPTGRFNMNLSRSKLSEPTEQALKTYLSQNPIKLWYELKNPIVTTDIVLPNGVHDEYNPLTGLYTKRVGYVELDGSDDEGWSPQIGTGNDTHCYASISIDGTISPQMKHMATHDEVYIMSDKFETVPRSNFSYDREQLYVWSVRTVYLNILQSRLSTIDITGFRQYLSQNPIKLWYELQTPITYQLTPYFGLPMPYAYKNGYLIMDSAYEGQTLPPEITYQLTINRTGQITQNNIKLKEHTARLSNLEYILIEATLESIFSREMQKFELELMNVELFNLDE